MAETARERDDAAAVWAVRLEEHGDDPGVAEGARDWLDGDPMRAGALARAQAALSLLNRGRALSGQLPLAPRRNRRLFIGGGIGVALAASLAIAVVLPPTRPIQTEVGEIRMVPLSDGSTATVNTDSTLRVSLRDRTRRVRLEKGEAWFKVAHDRARPFIVEAGDVRVRAVGTAFSVRVRDGGADVLVTEGVVETWIAGRPERKVRIASGSKAHVSPEQPAQAVAAEAEIDRDLAWRNGEIALDGRTLAAAAEQFNRYNRRKLVVEDPQLAGERLVGRFATDDPMEFANAAATTLGARVVADDSTIRLYRR